MQRMAGGIALLFGFALTLLMSSLDCSAQSPRPNVLLIFSDDHAYQAISAYDDRLTRTPQIDALASSGIRFNRCLVTNSICGPSRATLLTGKYSHKNGFFDNSCTFDGHQVTLPKLLQDADYQTGVIGKWHLRSEPIGFDHWSILNDQGEYYNPDFLGPEGKTRQQGYATDLITDQAIDWLQNKRSRDKPFFLMVGHKAPHREWLPGPAHLRDWADASLPEPETLFDDYANRASVIGAQAMTIARHMRMGFDLKYWGSSSAEQKDRASFFGRMNPQQQAAIESAYEKENRQFAENPPSGDALVRWKYQRYIKDYLRCIASVDDSVGKLTKAIDELGLSANTIVIYTSDQGFYLGEHGWYDKRWIFEQSLRTPLIVRWPGATQPGSTSDAIVSNLDFAPTILDAAGIAADRGMQGRSFVPLLKGEIPPDWRTSFYYHYYETTTHHVPAHYGVVTDRYKLVRYYQTRDGGKEVPIDQWELLDLQSNPQETRSFLNEPAHRDAQSELLAELERLRKQFDVSDDVDNAPR